MSAFRDFIDLILDGEQLSDGTRRCLHCTKILTLDAFSKDAHVCIPCAKESMRTREQRYKQSAKGKETRRRYAQTPERKAYAVAREKRWRTNNREKVQAHCAVKYAIRMNRLPRASTQQCACGEPAHDWHHIHGYARENRLRVMALCRKCHQQHHNSVIHSPH